MSKQLPAPYGKYILLNKIALGGMAEIFRAKTIGAEGFEKQVVIKRILPHFTEDEAFVTMFIDEAKVSSGLNHPNIVQIYDFDLYDETYYIAMEYIEGKDLKRVMDTGVKTGKPLSVPQIVNITMATCRGLHYAHTKKKSGQPLNIIHRDVSPHNVMVSYDGDVKVMDFGIAKAAARSTKTRAGTVKGKCAYMSPEQARGKDIDPRSDMFAVGVIMWEALTHRRLFAGDSDFETLSNVLKAEVPPPSSINPDVPPEIDAILLKCLAKNREDRQENCKGLQRELEQWFYSTVEDHERAELSWYMQEMFTDDLRALREMQQADQKTSFVAAVDEVRAARGGSSSQIARHRTDSKMMRQQQPPPADGPLNDARTVALDVGPGSAVAQGMNADRTLAIDPSAAAALHPPKKKSGIGVPVAIFIVLALLGLAGWFGYKEFFGAGEPAKTKPPPANVARTANSRPGPTHGTETTRPKTTHPAEQPTEPTNPKNGSPENTNGTPVEPKPVETHPTEAKPSETHPAEADPTEPVEVKPVEPKPPEGPKEATIIIAVIPADAEVSVPGVPVDKRPDGTFAVRVKVGDRLTVLATHERYERETKDFKVESDGQRVSLVLEKKPEVVQPVVAANANVELTVVPVEAALSVDGTELPRAENGIYVVKPKLGDTISVVISAPKHQAVKESIKVITAEYKKTFKLKKRKEEPKGPGKARFNAKPWARVTVGGKSCTTPCTLELLGPKGYQATFKQGPNTKSRGFRVRAGKTTSVFADMTK